MSRFVIFALNFFLVTTFLLYCSSTAYADDEPLLFTNKSVEEILSRAKNGDALAQVNLALMYHEGEGVTRDDAEAAKWNRKAADQGNKAAQYNLGVMCYEGEGVEQSYPEAIKWFRKAANQDWVSAQYNLGIMYREGQGVGQNYPEAMQWFRKAADQGHAAAQYSLGVMYLEGKGTRPGFAEAKKWFRKAAKQGYSLAKSGLALINNKASPVPFPFFDVPAHCRENGGSMCEYREQQSYDAVKGYWRLLNDDERARCVNLTTNTFGEDSGFYSNLLHCLRGAYEHSATLKQIQDMEKHKFHY